MTGGKGWTGALRIPLGDLEEARRDPAAYRRRRETEGDEGFPVKSRYQLLTQAVYRYHRSRGDFMAAREYLETRHAERFKSQSELPGLVDQLAAYVSEYSALARRHYYAIKTRDRIRLALPEEYQSRFSVTGEVSRLDMSPDGHAAWLFVKRSGDWERDLRFPLVLATYPGLLNSLFAEIEIGVYDFSAARHQRLAFSPEQVETAQRILVATLAELATR